MMHLSRETLYAIAFDAAEPGAAEREHLALCDECRRELAGLVDLNGALALARRSTPSPAAMARYTGLFSEVQQRPSRLGSLLQTLRAALTWDSRQQFAMQGVRSGAVAAYRQLYSTGAAEIELLIEPAQQRYAIYGEIMGTDDANVGNSLVQLLNRDGVTVQEVEAGDDGQFRMTMLRGGIYRLLITPVDGPLIEVETLEIG
ncbi:MAG: hypothetical protein IPK16_31140 [Anaerolineales bacterium]|nr:hypothetical protein [Anaerolineales bacterium]